MMMDRRNFLGLVGAGFLLPFPQKQLRKITVLESLETEGVRYTLEYFPDLCAYFVREIVVDGEVFHDLTFELVRDRIVYLYKHVSVETYQFKPPFERVQWRAQKGKVIVPL